MEKKMNKSKGIKDELENFSKPNSAAEISSKE